jgi:general secretion pathway protein G
VPSGSKRQPRRGVTLIELLVVLAAIAVLATVVGPSLFRNVGDAKVSTARAQLDAYALALGAYRMDNEAFPSTEQGLEALRTNPLAGSGTRWRGPYVAKVIVPDPWGRPYVYEAPGRVNPETFDLYTLGRDGMPGGAGEDADLTSWGGPVPQ